MSCAVAALLGGMAGGFITGLVYGRRETRIYHQAAAAMEALMEQHAEVERDLTERIRELGGKA